MVLLLKLNIIGICKKKFYLRFNRLNMNLSITDVFISGTIGKIECEINLNIGEFWLLN